VNLSRAASSGATRQCRMLQTLMLDQFAIAIEAA
jgi:hypothetical protein